MTQKNITRTIGQGAHPSDSTIAADMHTILGNITAGQFGKLYLSAGHVTLDTCEIWILPSDTLIRRAFAERDLEGCNAVLVFCQDMYHTGLDWLLRGDWIDDFYKLADSTEPPKPTEFTQRDISRQAIIANYSSN